MTSRVAPDPVRYSVLVLGLAGAYFLAARFGLLLQLPGTNASPVWPPSGIGLAAVLLVGLRAWPGIALGAFLANLLTLPQTPAGSAAALAIAAGNTLESVVGFLALRRLVPSVNPFDRPRDVFRFLAAAAAACGVAATVGAASLWATGVIGGALVAPVWFTWWLGDAAGVLVLTPAVVCWWRTPRPVPAAGRRLELAAVVAVTVVTAELTFGGWFPVAVQYFVLVGPLWAAFRFGPRETALLPVLLSVVTVAHVWRWAAGPGPGPGVYVPFVSGAASTNDSLLMLQLFVCSVGVTAVTLAAAVAERTRTEDLLRDSEVRFRTVFEQAAVGVALIDTATGRFVRVNRRYGDLIGYTPDEMTRTTFMALTHPDDLQPDLDQMRRLVAGEVADFTLEKRLYHTDGRVVWVNLTVSPTWQPGGRPDTHIAVVEDVTGRKRAEEELRELNAGLERRVGERTDALRESEGRFRALFEQGADALFLRGPDRVLLDANQRACEALGYARDELIGMPFARFDPFISADRLAWVDAELAAGRSPAFETRHLRKDGTSFPVEVRIGRVELGGRPHHLSVARDVSDRKRTEAALRESEERFRSAFDAAPIGMALVAPDGRWLRVNQSLCDTVGYAKVELLATDFQAITHPDDLAADLGLVREMLAGTRPAYQMEKRYFHRQGHVVHVLLSVSLVRDAAGEPLYFVSQVKDITQRKEAEQALAARDALLRQFITHSPAAIAMFDRDVRYLQASARWLTDYHLDGQDVIGRSHYDVFPDVPERWKAIHRRVLAGAVERCDEDPFERADGSTVWLQWECQPWRDAAGAVGGLIMFTQVVTDRKRAEEQVRASLREKEVLLKEIHHRVKNNLQIVSALLDLQSGHTADAGVREMFKESRGRVKSMALIHERLYRSQDMARVNFAEYVRQLADDLYRTYKVSDDDVRLEVDVDLPPVPVDVAIPCGLLLNELVSNCFKHAFPDGTGGRVRVSLLRAGAAAAELAVADDGVGFPAGTDFRATASFGMQLVTTLVEQLGGTIDLGAGRGTTFTVRFPTTA